MTDPHILIIVTCLVKSATIFEGGSPGFSACTLLTDRELEFDTSAQCQRMVEIAAEEQASDPSQLQFVFCMPALLSKLPQVQKFLRGTPEPPKAANSPLQKFLRGECEPDECLEEGGRR